MVFRIFLGENTLFLSVHNYFFEWSSIEKDAVCPHNDVVMQLLNYQPNPDQGVMAVMHVVSAVTSLLPVVVSVRERGV